jgi:membrane protease YdiL (CAAX protease family)
VTELPSERADRAIRAWPAIGTWAVTWALGMVLVAPVVVLALGSELGDDIPIPVLGAATASAWTISIAGLLYASRRFGSGDVVADYAARFRPIDAIGVPIGVLTQLVAIPLLYLPLQEWWPDTFDDEQLEQRARELVDRAAGATTLILILIVVVGAPIVEELVYRGLLQRSLSSAIGPAAGLLVTSIWFALVHPSPVEYPGLALAGLVFGGTAMATGRTGASIVTHAAFNAAGIAVLVGGSGW